MWIYRPVVSNEDDDSDPRHPSFRIPYSIFTSPLDLLLIFREGLWRPRKIMTKVIIMTRYIIQFEGSTGPSPSLSLLTQKTGRTLVCKDSLPVRLESSLDNKSERPLHVSTRRKVVSCQWEFRSPTKGGLGTLVQKGSLKVLSSWDLETLRHVRTPRPERGFTYRVKPYY